MKKWAIVNCKTMIVEYVYDSETPTPHLFGAGWGDTTQCEHIEVREDAENLPVQQMEPQDVQVQVGVQHVALQSMTEARDENGDPILDANGDPLMVQDYEPQPVFETRKMAVPKDQE